jgi:hypothetical protein
MMSTFIALTKERTYQIVLLDQKGILVKAPNQMLYPRGKWVSAHC